MAPKWKFDTEVWMWIRQQNFKVFDGPQSMSGLFTRTAYTHEDKPKLSSNTKETSRLPINSRIVTPNMATGHIFELNHQFCEKLNLQLQLLPESTKRWWQLVLHMWIRQRQYQENRSRFKILWNIKEIVDESREMPYLIFTNWSEIRISSNTSPHILIWSVKLLSLATNWVTFTVTYFLSVVIIWYPQIDSLPAFHTSTRRKSPQQSPVFHPLDPHKTSNSPTVERGWDEWALAVQGCMNSVSDLFAADAVYHKTCYNRFITQLPHTLCKVKRGRPPKKDAVRAFECLCLNVKMKCIHWMICMIWSVVWLKILTSPVFTRKSTWRNCCKIGMTDTFISLPNQGEMM